MHVVRTGDYLGDIAAIHGCKVKQLLRHNRLKSDVIRPGQRIRIPKCTGRKNPYVREGRSKVIAHEVIPGENLGAIAQRYGTTVANIKRRNRMTSDRLRIGQRLKIRTRVAVRPRREFLYTVRKGDTLAKIGERYEMSWPEIQRMNPGANPRRLSVGQQLRLWKDGPKERSDTVGRPQEGRLRKGEQLPAGPGYYRRRPRFAWGTNETISRLLDVIRRVRKDHKGLHDLAIGDISRKDGGPLPGHASHQSGRDVDLGLYFHTYPKPPPKGFMSHTHPRHKLHLPAMWSLIAALAGKGDRSSHVEYIFLDRGLQKRIYDWAKAAGKPKRQLDWIFQYPDPSPKASGLVRHWPNHHDHLHVRFKCPRRNPKCR